jgi:hypothetical protein
MIQNYLISNCLLIIEDLNQRFSRHENDEILDFATKEFDESDLVFLLAYPFRNIMKVSMQGKNEDIIVKSLNFIIEVKYLYSTKSMAGNYTNKRSFQETFIKGWYNTYGSFSNLMQLGKSTGANPIVDIEKINYFPFLYAPSKNCHVNEVKYRYEEQSNAITFEESYKPDTVSIPNLKKGKVNCLFLGKETDKFHFAIYF